MTDTEFLRSLRRHLEAYKANVLGIREPGLWGKPSREYAHILPKALFELNILPTIRDRFWHEQGRVGWKLHRYFHHLSSSPPPNDTSGKKWNCQLRLPGSSRRWK